MLGFVIFCTFGEVFLTFHFFRRRRLTNGQESPHFCPKSIFKSRCKVFTKRKRLAKPSRMELWVSLESHGNHKMASLCYECG